VAHYQVTARAASAGHPSLTGLLLGLFPRAGAGSSMEFGLEAAAPSRFRTTCPQVMPAAPQNPRSCLCLQITQLTPAQTHQLQQVQYWLLGSQFKKEAATK